MGDPQVTIVVVPRERFGLAQRSLEDLYEHTTFPFRLTYVCAGAPSQVRRYLEGAARHKDFHLILSDRFLSPNQARNLALPTVTTKYVVFLDNDALVAPGWLEALVTCAEETGAWVVGPLYLIGEFKHQTIHMAGGVAHVEERAGQRILYDEHFLVDTTLPNLQTPLERRPCDYVEFHCALVRTEVFERLGPLDEQLWSAHEHIDLGLAVRQAGGAVYFEPAAMITFLPPPPGDWHDLPYFMVRWSEAWNRATVRHFNDKWGWSVVRSFDDRDSADPEDTIIRWARGYRRRMAGVRIPAEGTGSRPESPLEEARCMAALFQSVDRDSLDLMLAGEDERPLEEATALTPHEVMERLPGALARADELGVTILVRPLPGTRSHPTTLLRLDVDAGRLERLRPHAFLLLQTDPRTYQCWLAVARDDPRSVALWRRLGVAAPPAGPAFVPLAGSRNVSPDTRQADGSYPRVRLVEGTAGLLNPLWKLEEQGLLPLLRYSHLA